MEFLLERKVARDRHGQRSHGLTSSSCCLAGPAYLDLENKHLFESFFFFFQAMVLPEMLVFAGARARYRDGNQNPHVHALTSCMAVNQPLLPPFTN